MKKSLLAVAAAFAAVGAQAATITDSFGIPLALATTEINQTGQLDRFDASLGVLTGASLTLFGGAQFSFSGTNTAVQAQTARLTSSTDLLFSSDLVALSALFTGPISLSATSGFQTYASGETKNFGPFSGDDSQLYNLSTILAAVTGAGTFGVSCESFSGFTVTGGGGNISTTQETQAGCGAEITYIYDERITLVPEPSALALVGIALAGLGFTARRRKA